MGGTGVPFPLSIDTRSNRPPGDPLPTKAINGWQKPPKGTVKIASKKKRGKIKESGC